MYKFLTPEGKGEEGAAEGASQSHWEEGLDFPAEVQRLLKGEAKEKERREGKKRSKPRYSMVEQGDVWTKEEDNEEEELWKW
jgi:hypothetical protein